MASNCLRATEHYEEAVYFLPLSFQKFLVLIWSTSEIWKAVSTYPSDFEPLILKKCKKSKKCMLVVKIDDFYLKFVILLMNRTLETRCTHSISWCCLYCEEEISVFQSSQDTKCCFFEEERTCALPSGIGFELLMRVSVSW